MNKSALPPLLTALLAAACAPSAPPPLDLQAEIAALRAAAAYHEAASAKDPARVVALYDDEAVMVRPNADLVDGIEGVGGYRFGRPGGTVGSDLVRDFHVWKKQADGSWKVAADIWNSGNPAGR